MDIANAEGGLVVGTGDLSELALGWATYNGDHMSSYGVNAGVPKTLVKYLVRYEAERLGGAAKTALHDILNTEISPELLPPENGKIAQKTEDILGKYDLHDFIMYHYCRFGFTREKLSYLLGLRTPTSIKRSAKKRSTRFSSGFSRANSNGRVCPTELRSDRCRFRRGRIGACRATPTSKCDVALVLNILSSTVGVRIAGADFSRAEESRQF